MKFFKPKRKLSHKTRLHFMWVTPKIFSVVSKLLGILAHDRGLWRKEAQDGGGRQI